MSSWWNQWLSSSHAYTSASVENSGEPLVLNVAGLAFEGRAERLVHYQLGQFLRVRHEADNKYDPNALAIEDRKGFIIGYVDKHIARRLLPLVPALQKGVFAEITQLKRDVDGQSASLRVCLRCEEKVLEQLNKRYEIDFLVKTHEDGSCLLLLECSDTAYFRVLRRLRQRGFAQVGVGFSYKLASNGRLYDRYLKMASRHTEEELMDFFYQEFGVRPMEQETLALLDEMEAENKAEQAIFSSTIEELEQKLLRLEKEVQQLRPLAQGNQRLRGIEARLRKEYPNIIQALLPQLIFKRDSLKHLIEDITDPADVLSKLAILHTHRQLEEAKKVKGARDWWEVYYRTGKAENGRLYYQLKEDEVEVLVSIKQQQSQDMQYLRDH